MDRTSARRLMLAYARYRGGTVTGGEACSLDTGGLHIWFDPVRRVLRAQSIEFTGRYTTLREFIERIDALLPPPPPEPAPPALPDPLPGEPEDAAGVLRRIRHEFIYLGLPAGAPLDPSTASSPRLDRLWSTLADFEYVPTEDDLRFRLAPPPRSRSYRDFPDHEEREHYTQGVRRALAQMQAHPELARDALAFAQARLYELAGPAPPPPEPAYPPEPEIESFEDTFTGLEQDPETEWPKNVLKVALRLQALHAEMRRVCPRLDEPPRRLAFLIPAHEQPLRDLQDWLVPIFLELNERKTLPRDLPGQLARWAALLEPHRKAAPVVAALRAVSAAQ